MLAIVNRASVNTGDAGIFSNERFCLFWTRPGVGLQGHMAALFSVF